MILPGRSDATRQWFRRAWLFASSAVAAGLVVKAGDAYRFMPKAYERVPVVPLAADATRWDPAVWAPGETLEWFIVADDPGWEAVGVTPEEAREPIEMALSRWAAVPGADIRWRLGGMTTRDRHRAERQPAVVFSTDPEDPTTFAALSLRAKDESIWELTWCNVVLSYRDGTRLSSDRGQAIWMLMHEFGHCLGLQHTWAPNLWAEWFGETPDIWGTSPLMSYGRNWNARLLPDDMTGARLLRPDLTTRNDDGSIAGEVTVRGGPASYVYVMASPTFGSRRQGVGAFTDIRGRFEIEGLRPGNYRLRASPIQVPLAYRGDILTLSSYDAGDALALGPIAVRAGEVTGLVRLDLPDRPER